MVVSKLHLVLVGMVALSGCDTNDNSEGTTTVLINVPAITLKGDFTLNDGSFPLHNMKTG